ncbi:hypothetical protein [Microbacterium sp.]|uniref:hypothetical protein n=1 Tax=Microbacterium sp. TaxID=51671 RepID=UPI0025F55564|nr:hypothetical protein [Microbacterium sp.]MBT9605920.1 hypothetical protein [Microbacterium sp.]
MTSVMTRGARTALLCATVVIASFTLAGCAATGPSSDDGASTTEQSPGSDPAQASCNDLTGGAEIYNDGVTETDQADFAVNRCEVPGDAEIVQWLNTNGLRIQTVSRTNVGQTEDDVIFYVGLGGCMVTIAYFPAENAYSPYLNDGARTRYATPTEVGDAVLAKC